MGFIMTRPPLLPSFHDGRPPSPTRARIRGVVAIGLAVVAVLAMGCSDPSVAPPPPSRPSESPSSGASSPAATSAPTAATAAPTSASSKAASSDTKAFKTAIASDSTYQAEFPTAAIEEVQTLAGGARMVHLHTDKKGAVVYDVAWVGLSPEIAGLPASTLVERTVAGMTASDPNAKVEERTLAGIPDVPSAVMKREGPDGTVAWVAVFVAQGRLYQMSVTARAGASVESTDVDRFLGSFSLLAKPQTPPTPHP